MIYLIRHGQTDQNVAWKIQGQRDFPLNDTGAAQAEAAGESLRELGISFSKVYSSPLIRAVKTAEIVTEKSGEDFILDDRLKEMDYGRFEGADLKNLPEELKEFFRDFAHNPAPERHGAAYRPCEALRGLPGGREAGPYGAWPR